MFGRKGEIGIVIVLVFYLMAPLLVYNVLSASWISNFIAFLKTENVENLEWYFSPKAISVVFAFFIYPLCLLNDLSKLSVTSFMGLGFMSYVVCLVVFDLLIGNGVGDGMRWINNPGMDIFGGFAKIMFAFNSTSSAVSLVSAMKDKSSKARIKLTLTSSLITTLFYLVFIVCGYFIVGELMLIHDDILSTQSRLGYQIAAIAVSCVCVFSYPIIMYPARTSMDWLLSQKLNKFAFWKENQLFRTILILNGFLCFILPIAMYASSIATLVLGFISAVFGAVLMFLLPSIFILKIKHEIDLKVWEKVAVYFNLGLGIVVMLGGFVGQTRELYGKIESGTVFG